MVSIVNLITISLFFPFIPINFDLINTYCYIQTIDFQELMSLKLKDILEIIDGQVVCGNNRLNEEVDVGFASDLMSDVLTLPTNNLLLITGLANLQTIRTAEMADIYYIVLVRKKKVTAEILELAKENNQVIIECPYSMFKTIGLLYVAGLNAVY